jgi:hypothetical protein
MQIFIKAMVIQNNIAQAPEIPDGDVDELSSVVNVGVIVKNTFGCAISFIFSSNVIDKT